MLAFPQKDGNEEMRTLFLREDIDLAQREA